MTDTRSHETARSPLPARGGEEGAIAVILAGLFLVLAGMGALAIDLGRAFNLQTQLQKGADAAALACASELDGTTLVYQQALVAAYGYGSLNGETALARNTQHFANDGDPDVVHPFSTDAKFYAVWPGGPELNMTVPAIAATARFCRVTVSAHTMNFLFAHLIGPSPSITLGATAVATVETLVCQHPLLMICNMNSALGLPFNFNNSTLLGDMAGRGMMLAPVNSGNGTGANFGVLMPVNEAPNANRVRDAMGRDSPNEVCNRLGGANFQTAGAHTAYTVVSDGLNMRYGAPYPVGHTVPFAGEPPVAANDHYRAAGAVRSFPRDNGVFAQGSIPVAAGHHAVGNGVWNFAGYMAANHPGVNPSGPAGPKRSDGGTCTGALFAGKTDCSRFDVYRWEIGGLTNGATTPDRRILTIPVVNCAANPPTVNRWVEVFLTERAGAATIAGAANAHAAHQEFYVEFIGPAPRFGPAVMRRVVRLVE